MKKQPKNITQGEILANIERSQEKKRLREAFIEDLTVTDKGSFREKVKETLVFNDDKQPHQRLASSKRHPDSIAEPVYFFVERGRVKVTVIVQFVKGSKMLVDISWSNQISSMCIARYLTNDSRFEMQFSENGDPRINDPLVSALKAFIESLLGSQNI